MIEETPNCKVRIIWQFSKHHFDQLEELAKKLGYVDADDMFSMVTLGFLNKNGINPLQDWI